MRLLDRYLLRELLVPLGYCLGGFLIFWITFSLFNDLGSFQSHQLRLGDVVAYYLATTPEMLVTVIPVALLLALLYALTQHARHHELTAMRAAGVTLWRLMVPYFGVALVGSLALLTLNELAVPDGAEKAERILNSRVTVGVTDRAWQRAVVFNNDRDGRSWYIGAYNLETAEMRQPHIEWHLPDGGRRILDAESGLRTNEVWMLLGVQEQFTPAGGALPPPPSRSPQLLLPELAETPRLIRSEIRISRLASFKAARKAQLSIREIRDYLELHPGLDRSRSEQLRTMLNSRLALPWTCLVVVLISIPFGAASGRRNVFVGVASSVFICFIYFVLRELSLALGGGGRVSPWLAAWAPNLLFGLAGIIMTQRTR